MAHRQQRTPAPPTPKSRPSRSPKQPRRHLSAAPAAGSKVERLIALLGRRTGASIAEMMEATGWQAHSVRGALAGVLKRRGLVITSDKADGERRYRTGP